MSIASTRNYAIVRWLIHQFSTSSSRGCLFSRLEANMNNNKAMLLIGSGALTGLHHEMVP